MGNSEEIVKSILFVLGGGIGNIIQATPAIKAAASENWCVDVWLCSNATGRYNLSAEDMSIFNLPCVNTLHLSKAPPTKRYEHQLIGPMVIKSAPNCENLIRPHKNFQSHFPEAKIYYDMVEQIGVKTPMGNCEINIGVSGPQPKNPNTVAIYPGCKEDWAMKRWDKYDILARKFKNVALVGTRNDIYSQGNPAWFHKEWKWSSKTEIVTGSLREVAFYLSKCQMCIGNDGGLVHMAAAAGIPTFVIYGPTSSIKNIPFHIDAHPISIGLSCQPCQFQKRNKQLIFKARQRSCHNRMRCMKEMSVDYVYDEVRKWLK